MAYEQVHTLFDGWQVINTAPKCRVMGCDNPADNAGVNKYGKQTYHPDCAEHHKAKYQYKNGAKTKYKGFKKDYCENIDGRLGFTCTSTILSPKWQLDVDHIDGDGSNHDESNLQTLCKCCHAYKTMIYEDNLPMAKRKSTVEKKMNNRLAAEKETLNG